MVDEIGCVAFGQGGLELDCIGEDFELVMRLHSRMRLAKKKYRVVFIAEPVCWTEVPSTAAVLARQRRRWHRGLWDRWQDLWVALLVSVQENLAYRQLTAVWRIQGWWAALRGKKQVWGTMTRTGFESASK
ncbi:hypothetical protein GCM10027403_12060 [Arthrobacter tecti]